VSSVIEFEVRQEDLEAFFCHHARHAPYLIKEERRTRWFSASAIALVGLLLLKLDLAIAIAIFVGAFIYFVFYPFLGRRWYVRHNLRASSSGRGQEMGAVKLTLENDSILAEAKDSSSKYKLSAIHGIEESKSHYFVYVGPAMALVVPKNCNNSEAFIQEIRGANAAA
jgi:hypothetical protein